MAAVDVAAAHKDYRGSDVKSMMILSALLLVALSSQKQTSAQELSGEYAILLQTTCQMIVSGSATLQPGSSSNSVGTAVFTPRRKTNNAGMVIINETVIGGPLITSGTGSVASSPRHSTVAYSNSATTLTINGIRYNAVYSNIQNGIADRVFFNGVLNEGTFMNACSVFGTLRAATN
jgi:hypothetical protein